MTIQYTSPSKTKYDMPIGTMLLLSNGQKLLIFLGTRDKLSYYDENYPTLPQAIVYHIEDQKESNYPLYQFINDIQQGILHVIHVPDKNKT